MPPSKRYRLPLRQERSRINKEGHSTYGSYLTVISTQSTTEFPRFAVLVSKKVSLLAVERNRLRRQFSEMLTSLIPLLGSKDYLIIPKKNALGVGFDSLKQDLIKTLNVKFSV